MCQLPIIKQLFYMNYLASIKHYCTVCSCATFALLFFVFIFLHIRNGIYSIVLPGSSGWHIPFSLQTSATLYLVSMLDRRVLYWKSKGMHQALDPTEIICNYLVLIFGKCSLGCSGGEKRVKETSDARFPFTTTLQFTKSIIHKRTN